MWSRQPLFGLFHGLVALSLDLFLWPLGLFTPAPPPPHSTGGTKAVGQLSGCFSTRSLRVRKQKRHFDRNHFGLACLEMMGEIGGVSAPRVTRQERSRGAMV